MKKLLIIILIITLLLTGCNTNGNQDIMTTPQTNTPQTSISPALDNTQTDSPITITTPTNTLDTQPEEKISECHYVKLAMSDNDAVRNIIYCFNSAWINYVNNNDNSVYDYVLKPSPAENSINEFDTTNLKEEFLALEVTGVCVKDKIAYAAVYEELKKEKDGSIIIKKYKWIYRLEKEDNEWCIHSFSSKVPQTMLNDLSNFVDNNQIEDFIALADIITNIWIPDETTSFSYGKYCQDLAYVRLYEGINEYSKIEPLQPQDGVDLHKKDSWYLDIAAMYTLVGEYSKAHEIYDRIIDFNDVNVVGACIGKAETFRKQGSFNEMKQWLSKAELAFDNGDMLP